MTTDLQTISPRAPHQHINCCQRVAIWIHEHPTVAKVLQVALLILGIGALASLPFTAPLLTIGAVVAISIAGSLLTLAAAVSLFALDILIFPHHDMKNHMFEPGKCEGGSLYYEGDVPILSLDTDDPYLAGKAHGFLCGAAINRITSRFDLVLHAFTRAPRARQLPNILAKVRKTIPPEYVRELKGVIDGYNKWAKNHKCHFPKKLSVDDLILLHLEPEGLSNVSSLEKGVAKGKRSRAVACSAIVEKDPDLGCTVARNMDWASLGLVGSYSLVIKRKRSECYSSVEVGVPGFIGTLTGMNDQGLALAMNVCAGGIEKIQGMPSIFYNRVCLEHHRNVDEVETWVKRNKPLVPYHLTVADKERAKSIHFYQGPDHEHVKRSCSENQPLITLNYRYSPTPWAPLWHSKERQATLEHFFAHRSHRPLEKALALPYVNNWATTHRVLMQPKTGTFKVAFDNAFAGKARLHAVSVV